MRDASAGLGLVKEGGSLSESSEQEQRKLQEQRVQKLDEERRLVQSVQQAQKDRWLNWESVDDVQISWFEWFRLSSEHLKVFIQSAFDVAVSTANLRKCGMHESPSSRLCGAYGKLRYMQRNMILLSSAHRVEWLIF